MINWFYNFVVRVCYKLIWWATGKKLKRKHK